MNDERDGVIDNLLSELYALLTQHFGQEDLRTLCFELELDYDDLPAEGRASKARELILKMARDDRLDELVDKARQARPSASWPAIPDGYHLPAPDLDAFTSASVTPERPADWKNRLVLIDNVKRAWITSVLQESAPKSHRIAIGHKPYDEALADLWSDVRGQTAPGDEDTISYQPITEIIYEAGTVPSLLILGQPGSGKTVMLLELADYLIQAVEQDPNQPIPVVLNLASWGESRQEMEQWIVEELKTRYLVPVRMGNAWIKQEALFLLLDGLDDVAEEHRAGCIKAINQLRGEHNLASIVVCCRLAEYEAAGEKLQLNRAISLQQLNVTQIESYLASNGANIAGLHEVIEHDALLQEVARSPLMLNLMRQVFIGGADALTLPDFSTDDNPARSIREQRTEVLATYVDRMFRQHGASLDFSLDQTKAWLSWFAQNMVDHGQTILHIEQLQPSWLNTRIGRWLYILITRSLDGLVAAAMMWLFMVNQKQVETTGFEVMFKTIMAQLPVSLPLRFWPILVMNLLLGLLVALMDIIFYERNERRAMDAHAMKREKVRQTALIGLVVGVFSSGLLLLLGARFEQPTWLTWSAGESIVFMIFSYFLNGVNYRTDIHTVEKLSWSWPRALIAGAVGLVVGLLAIPANLTFNDNVDTSVLLSHLPLWVGVPALLAGLQGRRMGVSHRPNEGIRLSLRNAILAAVLFFVPLAIYGFLLLDGSITGGLVMGSILFIGAFWLFGGSIVVSHLVLRLLMAVQRLIPGRLVDFLNESTQVAYLYRVGGGYIFIHRSLQMYFADLWLSTFDHDRGSDPE